MLILYAYDTNEILVELIKKRSDADMLRAYYILYDTFRKCGAGAKVEHNG